MELCDFTKNIFKIIKSNENSMKYSKDFIKKTWYYNWLNSIKFQDIDIKYTMTKLNKDDVLPKVIEFSHSYWVDTESVKNELKNLDKCYEIDSSDIKFIVLTKHKIEMQLIHMLKFFEFMKSYFNIEQYERKPIVYFVLTPLEKKFDCEIVNLSRGYAGNTYIHDSTIAELCKRSYDLVLINWTYYGRHDFKTKHTIQPNNGYTLNDPNFHLLDLNVRKYHLYYLI